MCGGLFHHLENAEELIVFRLDERLRSDTFPVAAFALCRVLLMDNRLWPWLILAPEREDVREIHQLGEAESQALMTEIRRAASAIEALYSPDKINIGALGNVVPQLHIHVLGRREGDPAWPGPVWGSPRRERYAPAEAEAEAARIRAALGV
jgi:diadenosine tetraphosphate (Ap4A) HIT family hydrolase